MKLTYYQWEAHLKKQLAPAYIISGDDIVLKQEAIHSLRKAAQAAGYEKIRVTALHDEEVLYNALHATSLFNEKRLLELDFKSGHPNKALGQLLHEYANKPHPETLLLLDMNKLESTINKQSWYQTLEKQGIVLPIWPLNKEQLAQWVVHRAKKYQLHFTQEALSLLIDYVENNLIAAKQALEKIYLLKTEATIDVHLIKLILSDESQFNVFDFTEHLISGEHPRALAILKNLQQDDVEPVLILWSVTRELRLLVEIAKQRQQGSTLESLMTKHKIFGTRQTAIKKFLHKKTEADCWQYLTHAAHIDQMIKGAIALNPWEALQLFCLRF